MFGLDTNVLVRFLVRDDDKQSAAARRAIEQAVVVAQPLHVSLLTVLETEWVLRSHYRYSKDAILRTLKALLEARDLHFDDESTLEQAIYHYENHSADFADCLMIARYGRIGCNAMLTFDTRAALVPGAQLLTASVP